MTGWHQWAWVRFIGLRYSCNADGDGGAVLLPGAWAGAEFEKGTPWFSSVSWGSNPPPVGLSRSVRPPLPRAPSILHHTWIFNIISLTSTESFIQSQNTQVPLDSARCDSRVQTRSSTLVLISRLAGLSLRWSVGRGPAGT